MAKHKQCKICGQEATIHLTQIIENQIHKIDLCETCAHQKGLVDPEAFGLEHLIANQELDIPASFSEPDSKPSEACSLSGATFGDFQKTGRFGSAECYQKFHKKIIPLLKNMHKGIRHTGKVLSSHENKQELSEVIQLREELQRAIDDERFEEAAKLRDEIKQRTESLHI